MGPLSRLWGYAALLIPAIATGAEGDPRGAAEAYQSRSRVEVRATITHRGPRFPWILQLENVTDEAVAVVADPRLLWFEAAVPGKKRQIDCKLPDSMRPAAPVADSVVVLQPGDHVVRTFDPRFLCFSETEQTVLVPGTVLKIHYGWPTKTKTYWKAGKRVTEALDDTEPYIARAINRGTSRDPLKNLLGNYITLGTEYTRWGKRPERPDSEPQRDPDPTIEIQRGVDAHDERNVVVTVVLRNPRRNALKVFFRRELITFEVLSEQGLVECQATPDERDPAPMAYSNIGPGKSMSIASRVVELCPRGTFARPGFYLLHARFDANTSTEEHLLDAYSGSIQTRRPVPIRVRTGELPFLLVPEPPKPEPEAPAVTASDPEAKPAASGSKPEEKQSPARRQDKSTP